MSYYDVRFVFTSSCLLEGSCLIMMFGSSLPLVVCWKAHVLFTLFVFFVAYIGVQHTLCSVSVSIFVVLCTLYCQFLWILHCLLPFRYSLTFINKTHNHLSPQLFEYKADYEIQRWQSRSWLGTSPKMWAGLNRLKTSLDVASELLIIFCHRSCLLKQCNNCCQVKKGQIALVVNLSDDSRAPKVLTDIQIQILFRYILTRINRHST